MHICFLTHEYPKENLNPGGVGVFLRSFAPSLVAAGHSVTILGVNNIHQREESVEKGVRIIRIKKPKIKGLNWLLIAKDLNKSLKTIHSEYSLDIVEGAELSLAFIKKIQGIKYIIRLHGGHYFFAESENRSINPWKGFQEKKSFEKADGIIAVSDYVRSHTSKFHDFSKYHLKTIRYGIDLDKFKPQDNTVFAPLSMVFVGTICEKKGVENLVLAFKHVIDKYPEASLSIYGKDWFFPDGSSYTERIKELVKDLNLDRSISIFGPVPHARIPDIYASHEFCIFPSFMETQGLVAPEAMAMEKVVIFTDKGPGPETIVDGETGYLCNPLSVSDISQTIIRAFRNRKKNQLIGQEARITVFSKFCPSKTIPQNLAFYQEVVNG